MSKRRARIALEQIIRLFGYETVAAEFQRIEVLTTPPPKTYKSRRGKSRGKSHDERMIEINQLLGKGLTANDIAMTIGVSLSWATSLIRSLQHYKENGMWDDETGVHREWRHWGEDSAAVSS